MARTDSQSAGSMASIVRSIGAHSGSGMVAVAASYKSARSCTVTLFALRLASHNVTGGHQSVNCTGCPGDPHETSALFLATPVLLSAGGRARRKRDHLRGESGTGSRQAHCLSLG